MAYKHCVLKLDEEERNLAATWKKMKEYECWKDKCLFLWQQG